MAQQNDTFDCPAEIEKRLRRALTPSRIEIIDQSHRHVGHAGAADGAGHYDLTIVADAFDGQPTLNRHRLIYDALADLIPSKIHALGIHALAPDETPPRRE